MFILFSNSPESHNSIHQSAHMWIDPLTRSLYGIYYIPLAELPVTDLVGMFGLTAHLLSIYINVYSQ